VVNIILARNKCQALILPERKGVRADEGTIRFAVIKGGWFVGASRTSFHGTVSNIRSPYDVSGTYIAVGGGAAILAGGQVLVLQNEKGAVLRLNGKQIGLQVNIDFSGLAITVK